MSKKELWDFAAKLRHETEKAFLLFDGKKEVWCPKSLTEDNGDGTYTVPQWFAEKEGLV